MLDEIAPITLTTLYEMMADLTQMIELILSEYPSSSRRAPKVVMPSLPHLTSPTFATLGASHPQPRPHSVFHQYSSSITLATLTRSPFHLRDPPVIIVPQEQLHPCRRFFETFQAMGFLAPLAPRVLLDLVPS
ncbi:hypothetical protein AAG906_002251 [Vitis piasezkii]